MQNKIKKLKSILGEVSDLNYASAVLGWDQQTYMPSGGAEGRGSQLATLARLAHIRFTSDEVGQLLEDLAPYAEQIPADSDDARLIKVTRREYDKSTKVTPEWVSDFANETTLGNRCGKKQEKNLISACSNPIWKESLPYAAICRVLFSLRTCLRSAAGRF